MNKLHQYSYVVRFKEQNISLTNFPNFTTTSCVTRKKKTKNRDFFCQQKFVLSKHMNDVKDVILIKKLKILNFFTWFNIGGNKLWLEHHHEHKPWKAQKVKAIIGCKIERFLIYSIRVWVFSQTNRMLITSWSLFFVYWCNIQMVKMKMKSISKNCIINTDIKNIIKNQSLFLNQNTYKNISQRNRIPGFSHVMSFQKRTPLFT